MPITHLPTTGFEQLQNFYIERAEGLTEQQWQGDLFLAFDDVLGLLHEGRQEDAEALLLEIDEHVANVAAGYEESCVVAGELSAMGLLAHRWMGEAVEHLFAAVSVIADAANAEQAENALESAEWGCRLLVVVVEMSRYQEDQVREAA